MNSNGGSYDRNALLDQVERDAYQYLHDAKTRACSQTVLLAVQEALGQVDDMMVKACGPMAGGSRCGSLCGGLVGALLAIGVKYGVDLEHIADAAAHKASFEYSKKMYRQFEEEFGSWYCHTITGFDRNDMEQRKRWVESGGKERCAKLCGKAARMALEIILNG